MLRYDRKIDFFAMWIIDKKAIVATMYRNLQADIDAGYNPIGNCIKRQREEISAYEKDIDNSLELFKSMPETDINKWCFYDMVKRGIIE